MKVLCQIYKSLRNEEMYLYVEKTRGLAEVPDALMARFGEPQEVMSLLLSPQQKLARADATEVLRCLAEQGFYLQMPPTADELRRRDGQGE